MVFGVFLFFLDDGNKAVPYPKGKIKTFLYHCLSQLNALAEYCMQTGGGKEWNLGCRARALTVRSVWLRAARLSRAAPFP